jgi:hypothetical protein
MKLVFFLFAVFSTMVSGLVHHLSIHNDDRTVFKIETFGFVSGGEMKVKITDFSMHFTAKEMDEYNQVAATADHNATSNGEVTVVPGIHSHANATTQPVAAPVAPVVPVAPAAPATTPPSPVSPQQPPQTPLAPAPAPAPAAGASQGRVAAGSPAAAAEAAKAKADPDYVSPKRSRRNRRVRRRLADATALATTAPTSGNNSSSINPKPSGKVAPKYLVGFLMRHASSESAAQSDLENIIEKRQCILERVRSKDVFIDLSDSENWGKDIELKHEVSEDNVGLYSLIFARCYPSGVHYASFKLDATFYNPGPNYLSAGDAPLPSLYFTFFVLFSVALGMWAWLLRQSGPNSGTVHRIHYMMLILLVLKCLSLFFESVRFHFIAMYGVSELWSMVYFVFATMKGIMLFTVILLIGSGWSLMKSYLNPMVRVLHFLLPRFL